MPGANNIPMSYAGPPSHAEMNRNRGRAHHNNTYAFDHQQPKVLDYDNEAVGGMARGGGGGVVLSYSPPKDRSRPAKQAKPKGGARKTNNFVTEYQPVKQAPKTAAPKKYENVQSRVKDQIEYHKRLHRQKLEAGREDLVLKKDPQIYYKGSRPYPMQPSSVHAGGQNTAELGSAALRRRNSPLKDKPDT